MTFKKIGIREPFLTRYGDVEGNDSFFFWGESGGGKSTEVAKLFDHLTQIVGKGLYIAGEEGIGGTLQKRVLSVISEDNDNFDICSQATSWEEIVEMNAAKKARYRYKVVVIDSIQMYNNMHYAHYIKFRKAMPQAIFIVINQMKPDTGEPYGGNKIRHECTIKVKIVGGIANIQSRHLSTHHQDILFVPTNKQVQKPDNPQTTLL